jgi:hypothetical protein
MPFLQLTSIHIVGSHFSSRERRINEDGPDLDGELATLMVLATLPETPRRDERHGLAAARGAHHWHLW